MTGPQDPRVLQLIEDGLSEGHSLDEVCESHPELAPTIREQWEQLKNLEGQLESIFPSSGSGSRTGSAECSSSWDLLPMIPGYAVESILGRGGIGVVYKARHLRLDRLVAVKMLLAGNYASRLEVTRFTSEARAIAGMQHPNVVQIHDVGEFDGRPFYAMELVNGGSLAEKLVGNPQLPTSAAALVATLADAVESCHTRGVIHRDLKPANILLTIDGIPKISDFGLARRTDSDSALTLRGATLGTPCYMAPEQSSSRPGVVGPATDVYALGSILYEMLTGQPPFRGDSPLQTEQLMLSREAAFPVRPASRIPRDLQTICLKCLQKESSQRYVSAVDLAEDLRRFIRGEPVRARRTPLPTVFAKWVRRHPAVSVAAAALMVIVPGAVCSLAWSLSSQAAVRRTVEQDLREAIDFQKHSAWAQASAALDHATGTLGDGGSAELRHRLDQARRESMLVAQLDQIRNNHNGTMQSTLDHAQFDADYVAAFHNTQFAEVTDDPAVVAMRIRNSNIGSVLIMALDDWTFWAITPQRKEWLWAVARAADPNPSSWKGRARDPATWKNRAAIAELVRTTPTSDPSVPFLLVISQNLSIAHQDPVAFTLAVQKSHPGDLFANLVVAQQMQGVKNWPEAIRYYQAAIAIKPNCAVAHNGLAFSMLSTKRYPEAISECRECIRFDPQAADPHEILGMALSKTDQMNEGLEEMRAAIRLDPTSGGRIATLGQALGMAHRDAEAAVAFQQAIVLDPKSVDMRHELREALLRQHRYEEALTAWQGELKLAAVNPDAWDGYAELCMFLGHEDLYRTACHSLLDRFGNSTDAGLCDRIGRACLLSNHRDDDLLRRATACVDLSIIGEKATPHGYLPYFEFSKALADYRNGEYLETAAILRGNASRVLGPAPKLLSAMTQERLGNQDNARDILGKAIETFDSASKRATDHEAWIYQALRVEAEQLIPQG
jgi:serine/threonine protein kinase/tetratricopeptide (TPR) repeat protein